MFARSRLRYARNWATLGVSAWLVTGPSGARAQEQPFDVSVDGLGGASNRGVTEAMSAEVLGSYDSNLYNDTSAPVPAAGVDALLSFVLRIPTFGRTSWVSFANLGSGHRDGLFLGAGVEEQRFAASLKTGLTAPIYGGGDSVRPKLALSMNLKLAVAANPILASQINSVNQEASDTTDEGSPGAAPAPFPTDDFSNTHERVSVEGKALGQAGRQTRIAFDAALIKSYILSGDEYRAFQMGASVRQMLGRVSWASVGYSFERKWADPAATADGLGSISDVHTARVEFVTPVAPVVLRLSYAFADTLTFGEEASGSLRHQVGLRVDVPLEKSVALVAESRYVELRRGAGSDSTRFVVSLGVRVEFGEGIAPLEPLSW